MQRGAAFGCAPLLLRLGGGAAAGVEHGCAAGEDEGRAGDGQGEGGGVEGGEGAGGEAVEEPGGGEDGGEGAEGLHDEQGRSARSRARRRRRRSARKRMAAAGGGCGRRRGWRRRCGRRGGAGRRGWGVLGGVGCGVHREPPAGQELFGFVAGAEEEGADAEAVEAGGGGDFCVVHAFDVGEPEELALAGLEGWSMRAMSRVVSGVGCGGGLGRVGEGDGVAAAVAVAEEVGGDAEEVAAEFEGVEAGGGFRVEEEAAEGFLQEVVGDIAAGGDGEEIAVDVVALAS